LKAGNNQNDLLLIPVGGPHRESHRLDDNDAIVVGRTEACTIFLPDPSVSRQHCAFRRRGDRWLVTDLGSRNGTYVNSTQLEADSPTPIADGDLVRIGVYSFRLTGPDASTVESGTRARTDEGIGPGTIVERIDQGEIESLAHRRLELLIDGAAAIQQSANELGLARAIVELVLAGTGYQRAAVLRGADPWDEVEIVAARDQNAPGVEDFTFSRSLIREAGAGHVARLSEERPDLAANWGQSIDRLSIHSALCAPIAVDSTVLGAVYLDARGAERGGYEDAAGFCHAVARLAGLALSNLKRAELEARQRGLDRDLAAAQQAQSFLWPPDRGRVGGIEYALSAHPGRVIAGDLFDIMRLEGGRVGFCIGDVTGQGMGAAILMTAVQASLRAALARYGEPGQAVCDVNRYIVERSAAHMFATLWVGVFDASDGVLSVVDAGHGHWFKRAGGAPPEPGPRPGGPMIGIDAAFTYTAERIAMAPGDRVVLYSDGIVEHRGGADGDQFGLERLVAAVRDAASPTDDVDLAMTSLREYIGVRGLEDDTTIASVEVVGPS